METLVKYHASYRDFKQALDTEMHKVAEGFVKIGFLLNFATETNIVEEGGYANVNEFAKAEYNIDATQVSRFVNIYKRFGVDGEPRLKDQYTNHGVAKLGIMLTLPEYINEEITEDYSKSEITAIKREVEAEAEISDIEVMCEEKSTLQQLLPEGLKQLAMQFVKDYPATYEELYNAVEIEDVKEIMAPNEVATYTVRIPAVGKILMFVKANENIVATNVRNGEKNTYEWEDFFNAIKDYFVLGTDARARWSNIFQEPWPLEENTANPHNDNVQQVKSAPRKESKVKTPEPKKVVKTEETVSKTLENVTDSPENVSKEAETVSEQLPGQDNILNHPEYLPDDMKEQEVLTGEVEDITADASQIRADEIHVNTDNDNVQQAHEGMKVEHFAPVQQDDEETIRANKAIIRTELQIALDKCEKEDWAAVYAKATDIVMRAKKNMELEGKN